MDEDFNKGRRNDSSNVSDWREYERGQQHQKELDAIRGGGLGGPAPGMVITGESPILQFIVRIPFLAAGTVFYPLTLAATLVAGLLCDRLIQVPDTGSTWMRLLAYLPALVVFWLCLRWDVRMGERHPAYRRVRHIARVLAFALLGYGVAGLLPFAHTSGGSPFKLERLVGALGGATLGYFMLRSERWRDFWHATHAAFHIR